jgi:predicted nucleotidyltransferase
MSFQLELSVKLPEIAAICRRFGVRELSLFGSALGSEFRHDSDVDFLVEFIPEVSAGLIQLGLLQQELESVLRRKVDLVPKSGLKPMIRETVLQVSEPVYAG